ncbi:MAG: glycosyltransferase, partial [Candidatus Cloacimonetes bacterium]|nr:glycosyltransferase [Candidatus Cloacimonadota bacterium]
MVNSHNRVKIAIAAGGSGGHIIPAIAMGDALTHHGVELLYFAGKGGMEEKIYANRELPFSSIHIRKLHRAFKPGNLLVPFSLCGAIARSFFILSRFKPDAVIGAG